MLCFVISQTVGDTWPAFPRVSLSLSLRGTGRRGPWKRGWVSCTKTKLQLWALVDERPQVYPGQRKKHLSKCLTRHSRESNETFTSVSQHSQLFQLRCHYILECCQILTITLDLPDPPSKLCFVISQILGDTWPAFSRISLSLAPGDGKVAAYYTWFCYFMYSHSIPQVSHYQSLVLLWSSPV